MATCNGSLPNVGIVGTPDQIQLVAPILASEGFPLKAVWCNKEPDVAQQLAEELSIPHLSPTFQSLLLLQDVDLVYVATEPLLQAEVAVKAITSGKHCLSIKPPSISAKEAEKMLSLSQYYSQLSTVLETHMRFVPCFVKLKELIDANRLGSIFTIDVQIFTNSLIGKDSYSWKCDPSLGGGVLNLVGSHVIDLIRYLCPKPNEVQEVNCLLNTFTSHTHCIHGYRTIEADDYCLLQLKFPKSILASLLINSNCYSSQYQFNLTVTGSDGRATVREFNLYWQAKDCTEEKELFKQEISDSLSKEANRMNVSPSLYQSTVNGYSGLFKALREHFLLKDDSKDPKTCLATFSDGHHLRTILDCARHSHRSGRWVSVPSPEELDTSVANPFWTSGLQQSDIEKASPRSNYPVAYV